MPGQFFGALRSNHPMIGVDYHLPTPPGSPLPVPPPLPYVTMQTMMGFGITATFMPTTVLDGPSAVMTRGTDIGPMIPHIGAPSMTLFVEMLCSGSKSYFGPSYYNTKDQKGTAANPAVALLTIVNPNLNCGTPVPTPTGFVFAITTHPVGLSWGDILAGAIHMAVDTAVHGALFWIFYRLSKFGVFEKITSRIAEAVGVRTLSRTAARQLARAAGTRSNIGPAAKALQEAAAARLARFVGIGAPSLSYAVGQILGSPLGTSITTLPEVGGVQPKSLYDAGTDTGNKFIFGENEDGTPKNNLPDRAGAAFDNYLRNPSVETVNPPSSNAEPHDAGELPPGGLSGPPDASVGDGTIDPDSDAGVSR